MLAVHQRFLRTMFANELYLLVLLVTGSGTFSPGVTAALQYLQTLEKPWMDCPSQSDQANTTSSSTSCAGPVRGHTASGSSSSSKATCQRPSTAPAACRHMHDVGLSHESKGACSSSAGSSGPGVEEAKPAAERYWSTPANSTSTAGAALTPLLGSLYSGERENRS